MTEKEMKKLMQGMTREELMENYLLAKREQSYYMQEQFNYKSKWLGLKTDLEMAVLSLKPFKDKINKATTKAYENIIICIKKIEGEDKIN